MASMHQCINESQLVQRIQQIRIRIPLVLSHQFTTDKFQARGYQW